MIRIGQYTRQIALLVAVLWTVGAMGFDSAGWLIKRKMLTGEAERLRKLYDEYSEKATTPAENLSIPIDTYDDGAVKTMIIARRAQYFHEPGIVWAEDVLVKKIDRDGEIKVKITAKHCIVDRNSKSGWAEGTAQIVQGETTFTGKGVYFSSPEGYVMVMDRTEVVSRDLKFGGAL